MDAFALIVFGGLGLLLLAILLLGRFHPRSGAEILDWKPTRSYETEIELEQDDIEQMLEAQNARRRRTGRPELTEEQIRGEIAEHERAQAELRARGPGDPG